MFGNSECLHLGRVRRRPEARRLSIFIRTPAGSPRNHGCVRRTPIRARQAYFYLFSKNVSRADAQEQNFSRRDRQPLSDRHRQVAEPVRGALASSQRPRSRFGRGLAMYIGPYGMVNTFFLAFFIEFCVPTTLNASSHDFREPQPASAPGTPGAAIATPEHVYRMRALGATEIDRHGAASGLRNGPAAASAPDPRAHVGPALACLTLRSARVMESPHASTPRIHPHASSSSRSRWWARSHGLFLLWGRDLPSPHNPQEVEPPRKTVRARPPRRAHRRVLHRESQPDAARTDSRGDAPGGARDRGPPLLPSLGRGPRRASCARSPPTSPPAASARAPAPLHSNSRATPSSATPRRWSARSRRRSSPSAWSAPSRRRRSSSSTSTGSTSAKGTYGVEAASQRYFGKSCRDLTLPEAPCWPACPPIPAAYLADPPSRGGGPTPQFGSPPHGGRRRHRPRRRGGRRRAAEIRLAGGTARGVAVRLLHRDGAAWS